MRSLTFFAFALPALVSAEEKWVKRGGSGDMVVATIDGQVVSWVNNYFGPGGAPPASTPVVADKAPAQQPSTPPAPAPTPTTPVYQPPATTAQAPAQTSTTAAPPPPASSQSSSSPSGGNSGSTGSTGSSCAEGQQSIELTNNSGKDLHIQASPPWEVGQCSQIAVGATCTICQDRGATGGNLQVGYGVPNGRATWLEGNWDTDAQFPCMDISYIPGYSVPIVCTGSDGSSTIGMSDPLCTDEACSNCESGGGTYQDGACLNPMGAPETVLVNGPAPPFFSSATGIVYTYPNDSHDGYAPVWDSAKCVAHPQFGSGSSKRAVESPKAGEKREAHVHAHLGKKHRRHAHRHAVHGGSRL